MKLLYRSWPKARLLALVLGGLCALGVHAEQALRREVAQPLLAAQEALKAKRADEALALLAPARALKDLNESEQAFVLRVTAAAAMQARQYLVAVDALETLAQRKDVPEAERRNFLQSLVNASVNLKDYERASRWAREGLHLGPEGARFRLVLLQALNLLGRHAEVVAEMQKLPAGAPPNEAELRVLGASQLKLKDEAGYYQTLLQLLKVSASKDYWADLLPRVSQQPGFNPRLELDVYRLYEATGSLEEASDILEMAKLALKAGLPAEAVRVLEQGLARKALSGDAPQALLQQARKRAAEDEQSLAQLREAARDGNGWAQLAELYASAQRWEPALEGYRKAMELGGLRRPDEVRLNYGRCLIGAGQKPEALAVLAQVGGDSRAMAQLWTLLAQAAH